jgi:hypothetical protein
MCKISLKLNDYEDVHNTFLVYGYFGTNTLTMRKSLNVIFVEGFNGFNVPYRYGNCVNNDHAESCYQVATLSARPILPSALTDWGVGRNGLDSRTIL